MQSAPMGGGLHVVGGTWVSYPFSVLCLSAYRGPRPLGVGAGWPRPMTWMPHSPAATPLHTSGGCTQSEQLPSLWKACRKATTARRKSKAATALHLATHRGSGAVTETNFRKLVSVTFLVSVTTHELL